jgi:hypothetical protein
MPIVQRKVLVARTIPNLLEGPIHLLLKVNKIFRALEDIQCFPICCQMHLKSPRAKRSLSEAYATSNSSKFTIKGPNSHNILPSSAATSYNAAIRPRTAPYHSNTFSAKGNIEAFSAQMNKMSLKDETPEVGQPKTM